MRLGKGLGMSLGKGLGMRLGKGLGMSSSLGKGLGMMRFSVLGAVSTEIRKSPRHAVALHPSETLLRIAKRCLLLSRSQKLGYANTREG